MNKQKTNEKTSISNDSLNNVMSIAVNGPDLVDFDASRAVNSWPASGKRRLDTTFSHRRNKKRQPNDCSNYSILPITRTSKGPMKMVRVNECSSYPG